MVVLEYSHLVANSTDEGHDDRFGKCLKHHYEGLTVQEKVATELEEQNMEKCFHGK